MPKNTIAVLEAKASEAFFRVLNKVLWARKYPRDYGTGERLHMAEIEVIDRIANNVEVTMSRLADQLGVSKAAISPVVNKLESKGYLTKSISEVHGNIRHLSLTAKGRVAGRGFRAYRDRLHTYIKGVTKAELVAHIKLLEGVERFVDDFNSELRDDFNIERSL